jgi:hypothetical protein
MVSAATRSPGISRGIGRIRDPVREEQKAVSSPERHGDLIEGLAFADPEWQIVTVDHCAGPAPDVEDTGVSAIDEIEASAGAVDTSVTQGHKTPELDEVRSHVGMGQGHNFPGFRRYAGIRQRHQLAQSLREVALCRRAQECRRDSLAHHVRDDDVDALVLVGEELIEVAVYPLRRDGERGKAQSGDLPWRIIEQQHLLDLEADCDLVEEQFALPQSAFVALGSQPKRKVVRQRGEQVQFFLIEYAGFIGADNPASEEFITGYQWRGHA